MLLWNYAHTFYQKCSACGHYYPGQVLSKYDIGVTIDGPAHVAREEISFTYWLCEKCYLHELDRVDRELAGHVEPKEPSYQEELAAAQKEQSNG